MTALDYQTTPEGPPWFQSVEGSLLQDPSPAYCHQRVLGELYSAFHRYLERKPIARIVIAPFDVYLDDFNVFQPDILLVLEERVSIITQRGVMGPPDFVVEVLSPSNRRSDLGPKRQVYARAGVKRLWIIDPDAQSISDYDLPRQPKRPVRLWARSDAQALTCPLLPGFSLPPLRLFR